MKNILLISIFLCGSLSINAQVVCGTNPLGCGAALIAIVGTGTVSNTTSTYPAPYGNWYTSAKHQFLFTVAELNAAGIMGGEIDQIDFNVSAITPPGITAYHEYTINMGCTNLDTLTSWIAGLVNVYTPKTFNVVSGWNGHVFDLAYEWDGISNVVVEICFSEMPPTSNYTNNCSSPYTTTTFASCLYSISDVTSQCPNTGLTTKTNNRPNIRFHYCGSITNVKDTDLLNSKLYIFPNPNNGQFKFTGLGKEDSFEIYNILGEKVYSMNTGHQINSSMVDLSNQPNGIYSVKIKTELGVVFKKIVLNK